MVSTAVIEHRMHARAIIIPTQSYGNAVAPNFTDKLW